jgi:3-deoxy-manno-octulosonate cytidylyltransferase (CMP-KDO synthetase)
VVERCHTARSLSEVIVATDDQRIAAAVRPFARVEMTRPEHPNGTDRSPRLPPGSSATPS